MPSDDAFAKAKSYAARALDLDNGLGRGARCMGRILRMYDWKYSEADDELKRAVELEPTLHMLTPSRPGTNVTRAERRGRGRGAQGH